MLYVAISIWRKKGTTKEHLEKETEQAFKPIDKVERLSDADGMISFCVRCLCLSTLFILPP